VPDDAAADDALRTLGERLLVGAFASARRSNRADWRRMTLGVLKNRILLQTDQFDERAWRAARFSDFVALYPHLVQVDHSVKPPMAELLSTELDESQLGPISLPPTSDHPSFVRRDLWNGVVDYSSGRVYVWRDGIALPLAVEEVAEDGLKLPTLTRADMEAWRAEFVETAKSGMSSSDLSERLDSWLADSRTAAALPTVLRRQWLDYLKKRVIDRLLQWFDENGLTPPTELTVAPVPRAREADEAERLRDLLIRCVRIMSRSEMESLRIPPAVVLRLRR
jgi:hypothetical protein